MGKKILKIAGIQFAASEDKEKNIERAKHLATLASEEGVKIISFSELFNTIWFPHIEGGDISIKKRFSETIPGPTVEEFAPLAKKWEMVVVLPMSEIDGDTFYNSAAVIDADGKLLGTYRKVHIPRLPLWYEKDYFTPGDRLFPVFKTKYIRLGVQIC